MKALSGMEEEKYSKLVEKRIMMFLERWEKGEMVVREGEGLRVGDEVFETVSHLVDLGIFSKYVEILELRRQFDEVGEFCKVSEKPLGVEERFELVGELIGGDEVRVEAGMLETKYGVFWGCANWFDVVYLPKAHCPECRICQRVFGEVFQEAAKEVWRNALSKCLRCGSYEAWVWCED
jgi:hypothetical protein